MTSDIDPRAGGEGIEAPSTPSRASGQFAPQPRDTRHSFSHRLAIWVITLGLAGISLVGAFGAGIIFERNVLAVGDSPSNEPLSVFDVAWDTVVENYVEEDSISEPRMLEAAIEGMLATLGDEGHTRYLTAEETALDRESSRGVYQGVGIQVREDEEAGLLVTRVFPNSPAFEEGVQPGDVIVAVDGEDIREVPIDAIIAMIRGPEGTAVDVTIFRPSADDEITFALERREIEVSAVTWEMIKGNIALLRLSQFSERAGDDLSNALEEAKSEGATSVVLDLRGNPGGLVREAMSVASLFVPDDAPVYISRTRDGGEETHRAEPGAITIGDLPLVVLIDGGTASASEIVSGSIKTQSKNATIVGEQSVGTGTVLRRFELGDGSTIWLGIELWLTPDGDMIREQGISPDIVVPLAENQFPYEPAEIPSDGGSQIEDDQLNFAIDLLLDRTAYFPESSTAAQQAFAW